MEKYYIALTENNGFRWVTFQSDAENATADKTGFVAVGESFDNPDDAAHKAAVLNAFMFGA